jgi:phage-related protein
MERFFILDNINTWYDWTLILTEKTVAPPEAKTNYVELDGMNGTLDLSEALTGEVTYNDRTVSATFWTDNGTRKDREKLLQNIIATLHGRKIKIIEPDDPEHYFIGRVSVKPSENNLAYLEFTIDATCEPWRYSLNESNRIINATDTVSNIVIRNNGVKSICPTITVTGNIDITHNNIKTSLSDGTYIISDIRLKQGTNIISVSGNGSVILTYREATL